MIAGPVVPSEIRAALARYVEHHIETGGFLRAVLENDLFAAVARADALNAERLPALVQYIHDTVPTGCYGTRTRVAAWLEARRDPLPPDPNRGGNVTLLGPDI